MTPLESYAVLLGLMAGSVGVVLTLHLIARALGPTRAEPGKDVPFTGGTLDEKPVWVRYHVHYYGLALLFLAFDMEMAFMYPWAVVYQEVGLEALVDMGILGRGAVGRGLLLRERMRIRRSVRLELPLLELLTTSVALSAADESPPRGPGHCS